MSPQLPAFVRSNIIEIFGQRGRRWLAALPELIAERTKAWDLTIEGAAFSGGTHSYVAPVRRADGGMAVLKLPIVDEENIAEPSGLYFYQGDGAIRLHEYDPVSGAMLLEMASPGTALVEQSSGPHIEGRPENAAAVEAGSALYRRLWRRPGPLPEGFPPFPLATDLLRDWELDYRGPLPEDAVELPDDLLRHAIDLCGEFSTPEGPEGIVNRDTHLGNIVAAQREPWLLIDPKPFLGERAFDAGYLITVQVEFDPVPRFAREVVARTADALGVSRARAQGWGFLRAAENARWIESESGDLSLHLAVTQALLQSLLSSNSDARQRAFIACAPGKS